jgi:hypothetical protein
VIRACHEEARRASPHVVTLLRIEDDQGQRDKIRTNVDRSRPRSASRSSAASPPSRPLEARLRVASLLRAIAGSLWRCSCISKAGGVHMPQRSKRGRARPPLRPEGIHEGQKAMHEISAAAEVGPLRQKVTSRKQRSRSLVGGSAGGRQGAAAARQGA